MAFKGKINSRDFVKIFNKFDADGNGYIEKEEVDAFLKVLFKEKHGKDLSKAEIDTFKKDVMSQYDENCDGKFTMDELRKILDVEECLLAQYNLNQPLTSVDFIKIWNHYDVDKNGYLDRAELEGLIFELKLATGEGRPIDARQVKDLVDAIFDLYDSNKDGKIQLNELSRQIPVEDNFLAQFQCGDSLTKEEFEKMFRHYDQDASGEIEGDEITALLNDVLRSQGVSETPQDQLQSFKEQILQMFDENKDGKLSKSELQMLFGCK
ncbi:calbindin-32 [Exaiptasia diaphana]|uniref:EF-hand domain-containing protein n=1 Tax=Exaiptasia diaphana TaxID=2652724 RepID=A0A913XKH1_EXADI|nr:calbindin-32 [Exaiptasia diaphana]KXJ11298.1 Secretagogin [Exaiptasia diaphana]